MKPLVHLICDLECKGLGKITPVKYLEFTDSLVEFLELKVVHQHWNVFSNGSKFGPGILVILLLSESHLTLHTVPERKTLNLDIFSCKPFNEDVVYHMTRQMFEPIQYIQWRLLSR